MLAGSVSPGKMSNPAAEFCPFTFLIISIFLRQKVEIHFWQSGFHLHYENGAKAQFCMTRICTHSFVGNRAVGVIQGLHELPGLEDGDAGGSADTKTLPTASGMTLATLLLSFTHYTWAQWHLLTSTRGPPMRSQVLPGEHAFSRVR